VGPPGQRTFYLQARQADRLVTLKLEKQQVAALAQLLAELLSDLPSTGEPPADDSLALEEPVLAEWAVGGMQIAYDPGADRVVLMAEEAEFTQDEGDLEPDAGPGPETELSTGGSIGRLAFTREQAAALVTRGQELVSAGRPLCALCGNPIDPSGHSCPRTNGHRSRTP
jgi:uncharacterized repeat protein (TIGR03847 family)